MSPRRKRLSLRDVEASVEASAELLEIGTDEPDHALDLLTVLQGNVWTIAERLLAAAIATNECSSYADVDRFCGWTHGQARVIAKRIARRIRRAA